jgi:CRISPR/Cas system-associated exonuclease Cas4 (RecB family)
MVRVMPRETQEFSPYKVSPSRVNSYLSCGVAFRMKYIEGIPEQASGSSALFGSVVHEALEKWALNRQQDLVPLMASAWLAVTEGTSVNDFIGAYQSVAVEVMQAEKDAALDFVMKNGRETRAVRMTSHFKKSFAAKKELELLADWLPRLEAESPWRFNERDPLPALYGESLKLAKAYAEKYRQLPAALLTELGFDVEWRGFIVNGYIDAIEPRYDGSDELTGIVVLDYKTYAREPAEMKDWRQMVMYDVAIRALTDRDVLPVWLSAAIREGVDILVGCDYVRLGERKFWRITEADREELAKELTMYTSGVKAGVFLSAEKNRNPDFCPYPENCCLTTRGEGLSIRVEVDQ